MSDLDLERLAPLPEPDITTALVLDEVGQRVPMRLLGAYFTADQMRALREQVARAVLEEAAKAAQPDDSYQDEWFKAKADAVRRIRSLMPNVFSTTR